METELLPGVTIRVATSDDAATFAAIHEEVANWLWARGIHQWQPGTFPISWVQDAIARGEVYVSIESGAVIGAVMLQEADPDTWGRRASPTRRGIFMGCGCGAALRGAASAGR